MKSIQILNKEIKSLVGNKHHSEAWMHSFLSTNVINDSEVSKPADDRGT